VLAGWIAETLVDSRTHRIPHFVRQMSGGIVVKIDFVNHMDLGGLGGKISFYGVARGFRPANRPNQSLKPYLELKTGKAVGYREYLTRMVTTKRFFG
jgi:hypothetical protein